MSAIQRIRNMAELNYSKRMQGCGVGLVGGRPVVVKTKT